jgi:Cu(I)/Ag(I) efflux system membrane fusion protein
MKKYFVYAGVLVVGLILGGLLFGGPSTVEEAHDHSEIKAENVMWTCSMHPQIMLTEPGDCPICGMDMIPAGTGTESMSSNQFKLTEHAMALANVRTMVVSRSGPADHDLKLSGKIVENEESNAAQVSYFSGRIEQLNVNFTGDKVYKGQLLATIYSPELFVAQQELITASSLKESQPDLYKAVRNKLKLWKLTEEQIGEIESSGKVRENFPVFATVSGTVSEKLVEQGDYVKQGQPLLKIANLNSVWASFDVYENQINMIKEGQELLIKMNAYPDNEIRARVNFIDPVLDSRTRTVKMRAVLNNQNGYFKPGMFVEGRIKYITEKNDEVLRIPSSAILWTGERSVVYLKANTNEPVFEMREVTLGNRVGDNYELIEGLKEGDEIVSQGAFTVDAAAQLQGKTSMMNKEVGKSTTGHEGHSNMSMTNTHISFGVRGNCSMCKATIEKAAIGVQGVASAIWDMDKKKIDVSFDDSKTDVMAIHNAIAASGYDTEKVSGSLDAYYQLPECCQYDHEMAMNQSGEVKAKDHDH